jgi:drug/metabolite transporter (DMT)-like permease
MILAAAFYATRIGVIRQVSDALHPLEVAFFSSLFSILWMSPWILRGGVAALRTSRLRLYWLRALLSTGGLITWFAALAFMPLADAVALNFTYPLFGTIGAALVFREAVGRARWLATAVGFLGTLIIVRPGFHAVTVADVLPLAAAAFAAGSTLSVKELSRTEKASAIVAYMTLLTTPLALVPALFVWTAPDLETLAWLVVLAGLGTVASLTITRAFAVADTSAVMPFDFCRLPFVALIGFFGFGELPDLWTWVGAAVIIGATVEVARREPRAAARPAIRG